MVKDKFMKISTYDEILESKREFTEWNDLEKFVGEYEPVDDVEIIKFHRWLQRAVNYVSSVRSESYESLMELASEVAFTHPETNKHERAMIALRKYLRDVDNKDNKNDNMGSTS